MPKARIVVVEDEPAIRRGVADALRLTGYDGTEAGDGDTGLIEAVAGGVDLVLLDLLLPRKTGLQVLAELRKVCPARPVIVLTARGGEEDRIRGLTMGADDYVVKPFSARELLARVEAVLRRTLKPQPVVDVVHVGRGIVDLNRREIRWGADRVDLSAMTQDLAAILCVTDSGPGISPQQRQRLFEPFAASGARGGSGLGLAICREIVQSLGGSIDLINRPAADPGLRAQVTLPRGSSHEP